MVYIVEDDENIRELESYALKAAGYITKECETGKELDALLANSVPKLIILDLMLPGEDGISILKRLRSDARTRKIPVIIVSAKSEELDAVKGLDSGADDYITKPFGVMEFVSRVKAVMRRTENVQHQQIQVGAIKIDERCREVYVDGEKPILTYKEYELLLVLMKNENIVLSRNRLMDLVWGADFLGKSRTVDMHIKSLRKKLGVHGSQVRTVRNVGYKLEAE